MKSNKMSVTLNNTSYRTLEEALFKAKDKDKIKLLDNIIIDDTIEVTKNIEIDLNNKTIESTKRNDRSIIRLSRETSLVLKNGELKKSFSQVNGGAIFAEMGSILYLSNVYINDCQAFRCGGAIFLERSASLMIKDSLIRNCRCNQYGSAIFMEEDKEEIGRQEVSQVSTLALNGLTVENCKGLNTIAINKGSLISEGAGYSLFDNKTTDGEDDNFIWTKDPSLSWEQVMSSRMITILDDQGNIKHIGMGFDKIESANTAIARSTSFSNKITNKITEDELDITLIEAIKNETIGEGNDSDLYSSTVEIEGRTLENLFGKFGNPLYKRLPKAGAHYSENMYVVENKAGQTVQVEFSGSDYPILQPSTYYLARAKVAHNHDSDLYIKPSRNDDLTIYNKVVEGQGTETEGTVMSLFKFEGEPDYLVIETENSSNRGTINIFNVALYEITEDEFNQYKDLDTAQIESHFPYVEGLQGLVNPTIKTSEDLFFLTSGPYKKTQSCTLSNKEIKIETPGTYSLYIDGAKSTETLNVIIYNDKDDPNGEYLLQNTPAESKYVQINNTGYLFISIITDDVDDLYQRINEGIVKYTLTKGDVFKSPSQCKTSTIQFRTTLYEGERIYYSQDGYKKHSIYQAIELSDSKSISSSEKNREALKKFNPFHLPSRMRTSGMRKLFMIDGKELPYSEEIFDPQNPRSFYKVEKDGTDSYLKLTLDNNGTGWGDTYFNLSYSEIKAFLLGYIMHDEENVKYNDGTKLWSPIYLGLGNAFTQNDNPLSGKFIEDVNMDECPSESFYNKSNKISFFIYEKENPEELDISPIGSLLTGEGMVVKSYAGAIFGESFNASQLVDENNEIIINANRKLKYFPEYITKVTDGTSTIALKPVENPTNDQYMNVSSQPVKIDADKVDASNLKVDYTTCHTTPSDFNYSINVITSYRNNNTLIEDKINNLSRLLHNIEDKYNENIRTSAVSSTMLVKMDEETENVKTQIDKLEKKLDYFIAKLSLVLNDKI